MDVPNNIKEMIGKEYLFSGTIIDGEDRKEELFEVLDARISEYKMTNAQGENHCFELLVKNQDLEVWTKPIPIRKVDYSLKVV